MKAWLEFLLETIKMAILAFLIVFPIRYFIFQPFVVSGDSMFPNFADRDYLLIDEISFRFREPRRGEVVIFKAPLSLSARYIKRIIGLPGEIVNIGSGKIYITEGEGKVIMLNEFEYLPEDIFTSGKVEVHLGENEYYALGDNRPFSSDSRTWGILPKENIIGRVFFRALPVKSFSVIKEPEYDLVSQTTVFFGMAN